MNAMALATEQYRKIEVGTVNKLELLVMLFDGANRFLREAQEAIRRRDIATKAEKLDRVLAIIGELRASLNHEQGGDFAARMDALYAYVSQRILEASFHMDPAACDEAIGLLQPIREAWAELAKHPPVEPAAPPARPPVAATVFTAQAAPERAPLEIFG